MALSVSSHTSERISVSYRNDSSAASSVPIKGTVGFRTDENAKCLVNVGCFKSLRDVCQY